MPVYSKQSNLLQLADVLTGYVRSEMANDVRNPVKLAVNHYLKSELGYDHLENMDGKIVIKR